MFGVGRNFVAMCLTWAMISLPGFSYASNTLGIPTDLRVTSVHDLTIMLKWKRPLTTAGTPDNSSLSYVVSFSAVGINTNRQIVTTESAQLDLVVNKQYNIFVKAIQRANHQIHGAWSGALRVDTKDLAPAKPANLQMTNWRKGLTSTITVRWDKPRTTVQGITDTSILKYYVAYTNLESKKRRQIPTFTAERAILRLSANSRYKIQVKAYKTFNNTSQLAGPWSDFLTLKTNESVPSKSPTSVKVVSSTPSSINVSWGPIPKEGRNGIILGFVVFYREDGSSKWSERDVTLVYSLELTGLTAGKLYYVTVAGYTKIGRGTKSTRKSIIVGGQFITTTRKTTTQKPTTPNPTSTSTKQTIKITTKHCTLASASTTSVSETNPTTANPTSTSTKQTIKITTKHSTLASASTTSVSETNPTTVVAETPSSSTKTSRTVNVQVDTTEGPVKTTDVFSKEPNRTTSSYSVSENAAKPSVSSSVHPPQVDHSDQSTPAVAAIGRADEESKENLNKIMMIGAPAGGALLVMIILIIVFVSSIRRSRKRKQMQQNGEIPLKMIKSSRRRRSKDVVTRGASSVRYAPPSAQSTLSEDSMTEGLLQIGDEPDQPVIVVQPPNGSLPRTEVEDAPLLAAGYSEKCDHLRVDLSANETTLAEEGASGVYDSIGSLLRAGCSKEAKPNEGKSDDEERYVTQEQIDATRDNAQAQAAPNEDHYKRPKGGVVKNVPHGNTYENLPDTDHLYESLGLKDPEDPVYENTRALPSSDHENIDRGREYEPIPI